MERSLKAIFSSKPPWVVPILLVLAVGGGYLALQWWKERTIFPEGLIQANGRIEGDLISVSTKFMGRVQTLLVREGDTVKRGQVMVQLDDIQIHAQVEQSRQAWKALEAEVQGTHTDLAVLNLQVPLAIEAGEAKVKEIRAKLKKSLAVQKEAGQDLKRYRALYQHDNVSLQKLQQTQQKWEVAKNDVAALRSALTHAQKERAQAELGWKRIRAKEAEVAALESRRDQAEAALEEAESRLADFTIRAPANGTITTRMVDVGEVIPPGAPLFELVNFDRLYLKVYVPEIQIGKIRLSLPARIYTDAFPDHAFPAVVRSIASRAEFTPKEVQTPNERVKLTYAVKLYLEENPDHRLSPGMPADAVIRWKENVPWRKPEW